MPVNHSIIRRSMLLLTLWLTLCMRANGQAYAPKAMHELTDEITESGKGLDTYAADYAHMLLDAFHATGDNYYYNSARRLAKRKNVQSNAMLMLRLFAEKGDSTYWPYIRPAMMADTIVSPEMVKRCVEYYRMTNDSTFLTRIRRALSILESTTDKATYDELCSEHRFAQRINPIDIRRSSPFIDHTQAAFRPFTFLGQILGDNQPKYLRLMSLLLHKIMEPTRTRSGIYPDDFKARIGGKATALYVIRNKKGMEACFTNYGARMVTLMIPDKDNTFKDVVLGFQNIDDYHLNRQNFGATVGRYAGRIAHSTFTIDGHQYTTMNTGGGNTAHGGYPGFADQVWDVIETAPNRLRMQYVSPDGENGFPGQLTITLTVTLTDDDSLTFDYEATTDKPTVLNITHHSFFNISGDLVQEVSHEHLQIDADSIAEYAPDKNVTGQMLPVTGTPFDFRKMHSLGDSLSVKNSQMAITNGYDHSWLLRSKGSTAEPAVRLWDPVSGRMMTVFTTEPAAHIYMANGLRGIMSGKFAQAYPSRSAVCIETMHFADSPNQPNFPSTLLRPGETFYSTTIYQFSISL